MKKFYYLPNLKKDVVNFMARCFNCQYLRVECKHPGGFLPLIAIPEWKWEVISMELITCLPRIVRQNDSIIIVIGRLTKVAHFILVKSTLLASDVAHVFIRYVIKLHGVPKKIVLEKDASSLPSFGRSCFQVWAVSWPSIQLITHRQMDK